MYSDEESTPFFRRLAFSTDGALLVTPAGQHEDPSGSSTAIKTSKKPISSMNDADADASVVVDSSSPVVDKKASSKPNGAAISTGNGKLKSKILGPSSTSYVFARGQLANETPIAHLPGHRTSSIVVKFNPVLWDLRNKESSSLKGKGKAKALEQETDGEHPEQTMDIDGEEKIEAVEPALSPDAPTANGQTSTSASAEDDQQKSTGILKLKSRSVYALATHDTILIYDTQQEAPICMFSSLHFAAFTDLAW